MALSSQKGHSDDVPLQTAWSASAPKATPLLAWRWGFVLAKGWRGGLGQKETGKTSLISKPGQHEGQLLRFFPCFHLSQPFPGGLFNV